MPHSGTKQPRVWPGQLSIRRRLILSAGVIAAITILTSLAAGYSAVGTFRQIESIETAQERIEHLATISARVSDFAIVAVDTATGDFEIDRAEKRLSRVAADVEDAFESALQVIAAKMPAVGGDDRDRMQLSRLTHMQALFGMMERDIKLGLSTGAPSALSTSLDTFSSQFAPLLTDAVRAEQVKRRQATAAIGRLRYILVVLTLGAIAATVVLLVVFNKRVIEPLVTRINLIGEATKAISAGDFQINLPTRPADELGILFVRTNQMADALADSVRQVEDNRARLEVLVAERTSDLSIANQRLSQVDAERRRFFTDVSHELRTPLTVILAEAELAQDGSTDDMKTALSIIFARAGRLNRRIDDLLRLARSESGQIELDLHRTDLGTIARSAIEDMEPVFRKNGLSMRPGIDDGQFVVADPDWIRQLICGLLENAAKHSHEGQEVLLSVRPENGQAIVEVCDQGAGLNPDHAAEVFERFRKGRSTGNHNGFGLGLAMAKWIAEEHGGTITLTPGNAGLGLRATVSLPPAAG